MWIDINETLLNLDVYYKIKKTIDECESYKHYSIKLFFIDRSNKTDFTLLSFRTKKERDKIFDGLHDKIVKVILKSK